MAGTADRRDPRPRASARVGLVMAVTAASALGALAAGACLPDLSAIAGEPTLPEGAAPPFVGCGDGVIATLDDGGDAGESCDPGRTNDIDAQAPGCKVCQITCEGTLDPATGHCYFAAGSDTVYTDARTRCKTAGAHVVTFASLAEVAIVAGIPAADTGYWVGLARSATLSEAYGPDPSRAEEPGFPYPPAGPCDGCFGLGADGGVFPLENADASSPDCLVARGGSWFQVPCSGASRTTICEREPAGTRAKARIGVFFFTLPASAGKKTYLVAVSGTEPDQAAQSCAGLDGGSLVVLDSAEEREQLAHEVLALDPTAVEQQLWIGLVQDGGAWSWEDGVPAVAGGSRPLPWGNAQPGGASGSRAFMRLAATAYDTQLVYADDGGKTARRYVCQSPP